jgi:hypothetical protein
MFCKLINKLKFNYNKKRKKMKNINNFANLFNAIWFFERTNDSIFGVNVYDVKPLIDELTKDSTFSQKKLYEKIVKKLDTLSIEKSFESLSLKKPSLDARNEFKLKSNTISFDCFWASIDMDYNNSTEDVYINCALELSESLELDIEDEEFVIDKHYFGNSFSDGFTVELSVLGLIDKQFNT